MIIFSRINMTESMCLFGLMSVRMVTRVIAVFQLWFQFLFTARLIIKYVQFHAHGDPAADAVKATKMPYILLGMDELAIDISMFSQLSGSLLAMYANFYLRKATYTHNLQYINFWMILSGVNFITSVSFYIFASWRVGKFEIFLFGLVGCGLEAYKIYIVYQFYMDEISVDLIPNIGQLNSTSQTNSFSQNHAVDMEQDTRMDQYY